MQLIFKEFASATSRNQFTIALVNRERINDQEYLAFLFFEWVAPEIEYGRVFNIVSLAWKKFVDSFKSELGKSSAAKRESSGAQHHEVTHQETDDGFKNSITAALKVAQLEFAREFIINLQDANLETVDVNFSIGVISISVAAVARFGNQDIYVAKGGEVKDITNLVPTAASLGKMEFLLLNSDSPYLILISNEGLLDALKEANILEADSLIGLMSTLSEQVDSFLENKKILSIGAVALGEDGFNNVLKPHVVDSGGEAQSAMVGELENYTDLQKSRRDKANFSPNIRQVAEINQVGLIVDGVRKFYTSAIERGKAVSQALYSNMQSGWKLLRKRFFKQEDAMSAKGVKKQSEPSHRLQSPTKSIEHPQSILQETSVKAPLKRDVSTPLVDRINDTYLGLDPVKYFKLKRSLFGRLIIWLLKLKRWLFYRYDRKRGLQDHAKADRLPGSIKGVTGPLVRGKGVVQILTLPVRFVQSLTFFAKLTLSGILLAVAGVIFLIFSINRTNQLKAQDASLIQKLEQDYKELAAVADSLQKVDNRDNIGLYNKCFSLSDTLLDSAQEIKQQIKIHKNQGRVDQLAGDIKKVKNICKELYADAFNLQSLSDIQVLKDFKAQLGDASDVQDLVIYKGVLIVADKGKKSIYQVNTANGSIVRLDDPKGIIKEPISVGMGETTTGVPIVLVCDKQSGVVYYTQDSGFVQVAGTDKAALGGVTCDRIAGFGMNIYFTTTAQEAIYKIVYVGSGYALPQRYIKAPAGYKIVDFAIDGSIYVGLRSLKQPYVYTIYKYFGGKKDNFVLNKTDQSRLRQLDDMFTNPSGVKPLYILDKKAGYIYVMEKPTQTKHPGIGVFVRTYTIPKSYSSIEKIAIELSVHNNREVSLYLLNDLDQLLKVRLE